MISFKLNRSDYQLIGVFTVFMFFWLSLKFWTENHPFRQIIFDIPIIIVKTLAGFFILRWLIQKYIVKKKQYFLFLVLSTSALIATGFIDLLRDYYGRGLGWNDLPYAGYIIIHSFYYSAADLALPFVIIVAKKYFEKQIQLAKAKEQQKVSELKLLRSQLSPHFLFNNLNTVDALIDTNPKQAKLYIAKLSSLYRYLISTKDKELVALNEEIEMVKDYIFLIQTRFGSAYEFKLDSNLLEKATERHLPTGALQTVIENVVKHNKVHKNKPITTNFTIQNDLLIISNNKGEVNNNSMSSGTGLANLNERYQLLLDKVIAIDANEREFSVKLPLTQLIRV